MLDGTSVYPGEQLRRRSGFEYQFIHGWRRHRRKQDPDRRYYSDPTPETGGCICGESPGLPERPGYRKAG